MRLSEQQRKAIVEATRAAFGPDAEVWLFGSRVDDSKRGGDIDLLIRPDPAVTDQLLSRKIRLLGHLERTLGERKIDVVIEHEADSRPIVQVARETGIRL